MTLKFMLDCRMYGDVIVNIYAPTTCKSGNLGNLKSEMLKSEDKLWSMKVDNWRLTGNTMEIWVS